MTCMQPSSSLPVQSLQGPRAERSWTAEGMWWGWPPLWRPAMCWGRECATPFLTSEEVSLMKTCSWPFCHWPDLFWVGPERVRHGRRDHLSLRKRVRGGTSHCFNLFLLLGVIITCGVQRKGGRVAIERGWGLFQDALIRDFYGKQQPSPRNPDGVCKLPVDLWSMLETRCYFLSLVSLHSDDVCLFWDNDETLRY